MQQDQNKKTEVDSREINPTEEKLKNTLMEVSSKPGRKLKFNPSDRGKNIKLMLIVIGCLLIAGLTLVVIIGQSSKKPAIQDSNDPDVGRPFDDNNNSQDYRPSPEGDFKGLSIDTSVQIPANASSQILNVSLGQQATFSNGFAIIATSVDRGFKPKSEFDYNKVDELGRQYVRVNLLVGNLSQTNIPIDYDSLALYLHTAEEGNNNIEVQRITEGIYSPVEGQLLGSNQVRKISVHYIVNKSSTGLSLTRSVQFKQKESKKENIEKDPTLSLNIKLD